MGSSGFQFSLGGVSKKPATKLTFGGLGTPKPKLPIAFAEDSDSEGEGAAKKQRTDTGHAAASPSRPPPLPLDPEVLKVADRLAEFVAKNGRSFENITKERNPGNTPFKFLFDPSCSDYQYYDAKVREYTAAQQGAQPAAPSASGPAQQPALPPQLPSAAAAAPQSQAPLPPQQHAQPLQPFQQQPRLQQQRQLYSEAAPPPPPQQDAVPPPPPAASAPAAEQPAMAGAPSVAAAATGGKAEEDALAAMEKFERMAAERERKRVAKEKKVELLNETAYDRRRQVAVHKVDGTRGHHMQDYIPPEELAKFLASGSDKHSQAAAQALEERSRIGADNVGHKLLSKMGWKEGQGLGASGSGMAAPIAATGAASGAGFKSGLGKQEHGAVEEGDDEFTLYRKRMQLGYKHRPNPLGNPRKSYY